MKTETLQEIAMNFVNTRSEKSFEKLYHRLRPGLRTMVLKYHTDPEIIDEILAITLSKAYTFVELYDQRWNFSTWIYKICQNECLMELRRINGTYSLDAMEEANIRVKPAHEKVDEWHIQIDISKLDKENRYDIDAVYQEVIDEIYNLPEPYQQVLFDREVEKLKYEEIAAKRNVNINTVRSRIHVAKKLIRMRWIEKRSKENIKGNVWVGNLLSVSIPPLSVEGSSVSEPNTSPSKK